MDGMHARMDGVKSADMRERQWRRTRYRSVEVAIYCNNCTYMYTPRFAARYKRYIQAGSARRGWGCRRQGTIVRGSVEREGIHPPIRRR